jgi:hypothetical protein
MGKELTHIVFRNGKPVTIHKYFSMAEPRPALVGIGWVVRCREVQARVPEQEFVVAATQDPCFTKRKVIIPKSRLLGLKPDHAPPIASGSSAVLEQTNAQRIEKAARYRPRVGSPLRLEAIVSDGALSPSQRKASTSDLIIVIPPAVTVLADNPLVEPLV